MYKTVDDDLSEYNFTLSLTSEKKTYNPNDNINITLELINKDSESIKLELYQIHFPIVNITNPEGKTFQLFHRNISVAHSYKIIKKNQSIITNLDLKEYAYFETSRNSYSAYSMNWSISGKYSCFGCAYNINSNILEFDII